MTVSVEKKNIEFKNRLPEDSVKVYPGGSPEVWKKRFEEIDAIYDEFLILEKEGRLGS